MDACSSCENQAIGGIDLGVKALATLSDGSAAEGPKALRSNLKRLRRLSRSHSRKVKGSANRQKSASNLAHLHAGSPTSGWRRCTRRSGPLSGCRGHWHRRPQRARHDGERQSCPSRRRCRPVRVPPTAWLQGGDAGRADPRGGPLVSVEQEVFRRQDLCGTDAIGSDLRVRPEPI